MNLRAGGRSLIFVAAFSILAAMSEASIRWNPITASDFFWGERSCNLWLADELNDGKMLYRDVFSNYGAFPAYLYAWLARAFGNSPQTFLRMQQVEILLTGILAWMLLRRDLKPFLAAFFLVVFLAPTLIFTAGRTAHVPVERFMILAVALAWRPASSSLIKSAFLGGALAGAMQLNKFGGGFVALGAWVLADACLHEISWMLLCKRWAVLLFGYLVVTMAWALLLFLWLPPVIAADVLWPYYMVANYKIYVDPGVRWPHWINTSQFLAIQIEPLVALVLTVAMVFVALFRRRMVLSDFADTAGSFLYLAWFFFLGLFIYFKHAWLIYENCWILILSCAWAWVRLPRLARQAAAAIFLLGLIISVHRLAKPLSADSGSLVKMPTGDWLWETKDETARRRATQTIVDELRAKEPGRQEVFVVGMGSGWHHFMKWPAANRISVWLMEGFVRPYDDAGIIDSLGTTAAVIVDEQVPSMNPRTWTQAVSTTGRLYPTGLSQNVCDRLAKKLGPPVIVDDECAVFPVVTERRNPNTR